MSYTFYSSFPPGMNDGKHIFVFGSNLAGRHGAGAALTAKKHWGAVQGVGSGHVGMSYAIPTKDEHLVVLPLAIIHAYVTCFLDYAAKLDGLRTFLITPIGTGLAGYKHEEIAPMFRGASANCCFTDAWRKYLTGDSACR